MNHEEAIKILRNVAFLSTDGVATIERIEQAIDTLEIVRCKDCKYRDTIPEFSNGLLEGCRWASEESPDDDDYCSYGERKDKKVYCKDCTYCSEDYCKKKDICVYEGDWCEEGET